RLPSVVVRHGDHRVQRRLEPVEPLEEVLGQLHRRDLALDHHLLELPRRQPVQRVIGHRIPLNRYRYAGACCSNSYDAFFGRTTANVSGSSPASTAYRSFAGITSSVPGGHTVSPTVAIPESTIITSVSE